jgi:hypothetical protein
MLSAIVFWLVAEYCDFSTKLTIKHNNRQVRMELWSSDNSEIKVWTKTYFTKRRAYKEYKIAIANAVLGGWQVLNAFPKRETWETKRSK